MIEAFILSPSYSPRAARFLTCQIHHFKLPCLHPAPPPACLQVYLLPPLPGHFPPHLQDERTGELLLTDGDGARGGAGASWLDDCPVPLLVEMPPATVVTPGSNTETFGPGTTNKGYNPGLALGIEILTCRVGRLPSGGRKDSVVGNSTQVSNLDKTWPSLHWTELDTSLLSLHFSLL